MPRARGGLRGAALWPGLLALAFAIIVASLWRQGPGAAASEVSRTVAVGDPAPVFAARAGDGSTVDLAALRGRPVWLAFGASWCAPCRAEAPDIQAVHAAGSGVAVVGIYVGEGEHEAAAFARRLGLTYPQIADPDRVLATRYLIGSLPTSVFVDRTGVVRAIRSGGLTPAQMNQALAEVTTG